MLQPDSSPEATCGVAVKAAVIREGCVVLRLTRVALQAGGWGFFT